MADTLGKPLSSEGWVRIYEMQDGYIALVEMTEGNDVPPGEVIMLSPDQQAWLYRQLGDLTARTRLDSR